MKEILCSIITIGDELLIGQTIDTNSAWIAQQLNAIGIQVIRRVAVGDVKDAIIQALDEEKKRVDIVILTGGLGPTSDDITKPLLCEYFNGTLVENEEVLKHVMSIFAKRNRPILASNVRQAMLPNTCQILFNEVGTAPGMLFEQDGKIFISLPGVPFEMQYIISTHVLSLLKEKFVAPNIIHRTLVTSGEGESFIANRLTDFEKELPKHIKLAYLPKLSIVKLRLTAINVDPKEIDVYFHSLKNILANIVVADTDIELEQELAQILTENKKTMSIAESCTGGYVASIMTSMKGSSAYFKGGMVPYSIESKIAVLGIHADTITSYTAVSEQTVQEMAEQCRLKFKSDYAISISGYLEKNDANNEVWIAVASTKEIKTKKIIVPYDREKNRILASNTALNLLRLFILEEGG